MYSYPIRSDELYHYGVLGMKWGQHKAVRAAVKEARGLRRTLGKQELSIARDKAHAGLAKARGKDAINYANHHDRKAMEYAAKGNSKKYEEHRQASFRGLTESKGHLEDYTNHIAKADNGRKQVDKKAVRREAKDNYMAKQGINVKRDSQNRVTSIGTSNPTNKNIKRIHKMQKRVARRGDY